MIRSTVPTLVTAVIMFIVTSGAEANERLSKQLGITATAAASEAIGRDDRAYRVMHSDEGRLRVVNLRAGFDAHFDPSGAGIVAGAATAELSVESIGRGATARAAGVAQLTWSDNRVELRRDGLVEWYVNGPAGLQHGMTISERPAPKGDGALVIGLGVSGDYRVTVNASGDSATLTSGGGPALHYSGLIAYDADGRELPAHMEANTGGLRLVVDDAGAAYPIVIDPFIQSDELFPATGDTTWFGWSVAVEGDTMVVGARYGDIEYAGDCQNGMAYVFERDGSPIWRLKARLQSSRPDPFCWGEEFGASVAISGDWLAVGSPTDFWLREGVELPPDIEHPNEAIPYFTYQGSVYLFRRPPGGWADATETEVLTELEGYQLDSTPPGGFGESVALDGTTLVVGAPWFGGGTPGTYSMDGTAFVYENPIDAGWERTARLLPPSETDSNFGASVAISGETVVVGNWVSYTDANSRFGSPTSAYVFEKPLDGWSNVGPVTARLTVTGATQYSVAIDDSTIVVGNPLQGQAFLFERPASGWVDQGPNVELLAPEPNFFYYGFAVAVDGDLVAVSSPIADVEAGAAYLYRRPEDGWGTPEDPTEPIGIEPTLRIQQDNARPGAGLDVGDSFGRSIAIDAGLVVGGAMWRWHWSVARQRNNFTAGSVFVFKDASDTTAPIARIARSPTLPSGGFGWDIDPVGITVTAEDDPTGSGIAEIRCAVDPPLFPTIFAELPDAPCPYLDGAAISADGEHWVYAASVDAEGNRSAVEELAVRIDTVAPVPLITLNPPTPDGPDGTYTVPVYVLLAIDSSGGSSGSGAHDTRCVFDPPVAPASFADLPTISCGSDFFRDPGRDIASDGVHTIWLASKDPAGNVSTLSSRTFTIRRVPSATVTVTPGTPDGENGWYVAPARVTVTGQSSQGGPVAEIRCVLDPPSAPASFASLPASCPFTGAGALVGADGEHTVYAASRDASNAVSPVQSISFQVDATAPELTCEGTGPARFTIGATAGELTALVDDATSGPAVAGVSVTLTAGDLDSPGLRTASLSGRDLAGNEGSVDCAYVVGYDLGIVSPAPGAVFPVGATIPVIYQLSDANGTPIPDSTAALLAGGKRTPCFIDALLDGTAQRGCPTYAAATDRFTSSIKTPKRRGSAGLHEVAIRVRAPDAPGTTLNYGFVIVELR